MHHTLEFNFYIILELISDVVGFFLCVRIEELNSVYIYVYLFFSGFFSP